jgi:hypothetical protein
MHVTPTRSYRCYHHPLDRDRFPAPSETGVLPFVQLRAANAEQAQRAAYAVTGCPIVDVERHDEVAA